MTDDLRALAERYFEACDGVEGGISRLAGAVLALLTSLEAAEAALTVARNHPKWNLSLPDEWLEWLAELDAALHASGGREEKPNE